MCRDKQALGKDIESVHVEELGVTLSREEIFMVLVIDMMEGAIEVDWRDFFPYLRWIPNKRMENKIRRMALRRTLVTNALIRDQKKRIASGEVTYDTLKKINTQMDISTICAYVVYNF